MGDFRDINDTIYERVMDELSECGYNDLTAEQNNKIVDSITGYELDDEDAFKELVEAAMKIVQ